MDILFNNKNLETYGLKCLDFTDILTFANIREDQRVWVDKSGVDRNLNNIRYDVKEFSLPIIVKAADLQQAYSKVRIFLEDLYFWGVFVISIRDLAIDMREAFLCQRSAAISADVNIRLFNTLYYFKLSLQDVNPNALKYYNSVISGNSEIVYDKGQSAVLYWGDGSRSQVSNSDTYIKNDFEQDGLIDIIIDIDQNADVVETLISEFSADVTDGILPQTVQFTNQSIGSPILYSWNFGDGFTSDEENPQHTYTNVGSYTVSLQIFNEAQGSSTETKIDYITIRKAVLLINSIDAFLINNTDKFTIN